MSTAQEAGREMGSGDLLSCSFLILLSIQVPRSWDGMFRMAVLLSVNFL